MVVGKSVSIDDVRGNIFPLQLGESQIKVIPSYSPGYILQHSEDESRCREIKKLVWQDMQLIRKEYDLIRKEYDHIRKEHDHTPKENDQAQFRKEHDHTPKENDQAQSCSPR